MAESKVFTREELEEKVKKIRESDVYALCVETAGLGSTKAKAKLDELNDKIAQIESFYDRPDQFHKLGGGGGVSFNDKLKVMFGEKYAPGSKAVERVITLFADDQAGIDRLIDFLTTQKIRFLVGKDFTVPSVLKAVNQEGRITRQDGGMITFVK